MWQSEEAGEGAETPPAFSPETSSLHPARRDGWLQKWRPTDTNAEATWLAMLCCLLSALLDIPPPCEHINTPLHVNRTHTTQTHIPLQTHNLLLHGPLRTPQGLRSRESWGGVPGVRFFWTKNCKRGKLPSCRAVAGGSSVPLPMNSSDLRASQHPSTRLVRRPCPSHSCKTKLNWNGNWKR